MKLPDVNVFVYAHDERARQHERAKGWLERQLSGDEPVALAWSGLLGFLRLSTNPALSDDPFTPGEALDLLQGWLEQPSATVIHPTDRHFPVLRSLLEDVGTAGNLTSDAHLATLALEHGATLASFDADFHRFGGLKFEFIS